MFESLGFVETTSREASVWLGLMVGFLFGILAERTKFCFRRSLVGEDRDRRRCEERRKEELGETVQCPLKVVVVHVEEVVRVLEVSEGVAVPTVPI